MSKKPERERPRFYTPVGEKSMTKQASKDECDINLIIQRHADTGHVSHINPKDPQFGNFASPYDLKSAMDAVNEANHRFSTLPAEVRQAANNSPVHFLEMLEEDESLDQLVDAGLGIRRPTEDDLIPQTGTPETTKSLAEKPDKQPPPKGDD